MSLYMMGIEKIKSDQQSLRDTMTGHAQSGFGVDHRATGSLSLFSSLSNRTLPPSSPPPTSIRDDGKQQQDQPPPARFLPQPHRRARQGPLAAASRNKASPCGGGGGRRAWPEEDCDRGGREPRVEDGVALGAFPCRAEHRLHRPRQRHRAILQAR